MLRSYFLPRIEYLLRNMQIIPPMISKLDPCMPYGFDVILGIVLKRCALELPPVLLKLYNKSINPLLLFCFPACLKLSFEVTVSGSLLTLRITALLVSYNFLAKYCRLYTMPNSLGVSHYTVSFRINNKVSVVSTVLLLMCYNWIYQALDTNSRCGLEVFNWV